MKKNYTLREVLDRCSILIFVTGIIGIALKISTFLDKWVFLPFFPDILDMTFLIAGAVYLGWRATRSLSTRRE